MQVDLRMPFALKAIDYGGVLAGKRPVVTSNGSFTRGLFISSTVTPTGTFVIPMTGGSPFLTNSYNPLEVGQ